MNFAVYELFFYFYNLKLKKFNNLNFIQIQKYFTEVQ